jgi:hypothetical protein
MTMKALLRRVAYLLVPRVLCVALLLTAPALAAQGFPVSGKVLDTATGQPVARATLDLTPIDAGEDAPPVEVAASPGQNRGQGFRGRHFGAGTPPKPALADVTTGPDGSFLFPAVPSGRYRLSAARRGYAVASFDEHGRFFSAVIVGASTPSTGMRFLLQPDALIEGTLLDSSGDPVETASLTLFCQVDDGSGSIQRVRNTFVQQGTSSFTFTDLPPGTYYLSASSHTWYAENQPPSSADAGAPNPLDVVYPTTFYAGADSAAGAQPIVLAAGEDAHADMTLSAVQAVHLQLPSGDGPGSFVPPQLTQSAFSDSLPVPAWQMSFQAAEAGKVALRTIAVAPGTYTLHTGGGETTLDAANGVTLPAVVEPSPGIRVDGRVAMADGSALPAGTQLQLTPIEETAQQGRLEGSFVFEGGGSLRLSGRRGAGGSGGFPRLRVRSVEVALRTDGSFHADAVPSGDYKLVLSARAPDNLLMTGAAVSGAQVAGNASGDFILHVETANTMLAATVVRAASSIQGVVVNSSGAPEAGVMVLLASADSKLPGLTRQEESNSDGSWSIRDLPAGAYRVLAIRDGWDLAWKTPAVLAPYLTSSISAQVPAEGELALKQPVPAQDR